MNINEELIKNAVEEAINEGIYDILFGDKQKDPTKNNGYFGIARSNIFINNAKRFIKNNQNFLSGASKKSLDGDIELTKKNIERSIAKIKKERLDKYNEFRNNEQKPKITEPGKSKRNGYTINGRRVSEEEFEDFWKNSKK